MLIRTQKLRGGDPVPRLAFCKQFVDMVEQNPAGFLDHLIVSDEAVFSLNSKINTKNVREYAACGEGNPPNHYVEFQQGADQVMVWVGLTRTGIVLGPHFVQGHLDTREYLRIVLYNVVQRDFRNHNIDNVTTWWQQDGAPAHTSNASMRYLNGQFPGRVISLRGGLPWPPGSPDLTVCDFFLVGYLKKKI